MVGRASRTYSTKYFCCSVGVCTIELWSGMYLSSEELAGVLQACPALHKLHLIACALEEPHIDLLTKAAGERAGLVDIRVDGKNSVVRAYISCLTVHAGSDVTAESLTQLRQILARKVSYQTSLFSHAAISNCGRRTKASFNSRILLI